MPRSLKCDRGICIEGLCGTKPLSPESEQPSGAKNHGGIHRGRGASAWATTASRGLPLFHHGFIKNLAGAVMAAPAGRCKAGFILKQIEIVNARLHVVANVAI